MPTALQQLLGETPKAQFVAETLFRQPLSRSGAASHFCEIGSWESLLEIAGNDQADVIDRVPRRAA